MDLLIGVVIGVVLAGVIYIVAMAVKKSRPDDQTPEAKDAAYYALKDKMALATSEDDYMALLAEFTFQQGKLHEKHYKKLFTEATRRIQEISANQKEYAEIEPKLQQLRALYDTTDKDQLFTELHRVNLGVDGIVTYDQLNTYGERGEVEQFSRTYDELLAVHLRRLLIVARDGTVEDYRRVMTLWEELDEFSGAGGEDRDEFVTEHVANEWNEMIVRFKRNPDLYNDIFGLDRLGRDGYKVILQKARQTGDLLSLRLSVLLAEVDYIVSEVLSEIVLEEFTKSLDDHYVTLGFKLEEDERTT